MRICPDCAAPLEEGAEGCPACGWRIEYIEGIPSLLSTVDRESSVFADYVDNYEILSRRELADPVTDDTYTDHMARRMVDVVDTLSGKEILDLGAGKGRLITHLLEHSPKRVAAVDISIGYLREFRFPPTVERWIANAENLPFVGAFDVIFSTDVLEHVLNPGAALYCINRALRPGGVFAVRVPLNENLLIYSRFFGNPYRYTHLRTYNRALLRDALHHAGFAPIRWYYDGFQPFYRTWFFRDTSFGKYLFQKLVSERFEDYWDTTRIDPRLGRLLMRPIEIGVVARKVADIPLPVIAQ